MVGLLVLGVSPCHYLNKAVHNVHHQNISIVINFRSGSIPFWFLPLAQLHLFDKDQYLMLLLAVFYSVNVTIIIVESVHYLLSWLGK